MSKVENKPMSVQKIEISQSKIMGKASKKQNRVKTGGFIRKISTRNEM